MSLARANTNQLLEAVEEGLLDKDQVIMACVTVSYTHLTLPTICSV